MAGDAPVREPQLARVALDDVEQVEPERGARVRGGALPVGTRGARARAPFGAEALALDALAGEDERGRERVEDRLAQRDVGLPRAHAHADHAPAAGDGDPRRLEVQDRAERDGREERHPPLAQERRVAAAQRVDDERGRAGRGPRAVGDRPRQPRHPRRQDGAMERVAIAADARERLHRRRAPSPRRWRGCGRGARGAPGRPGASSASAAATGLSRPAELPASARGSSRSGSPSRSIVPVADQRGSPPCGTSIVVSARTCRTSPAASSDVSCSQGWAARKSASPGSASVSSRSWRSRRRRANAVAGASPRIASSASTSAIAPRAQLSAGVAAQPRRRARGIVELDEPRRRLPRLAGARRPRRSGRDRVRGVDELREPRGELRVREQRGQRGPGEREREVGGHAVVRRAGGGAVRAREVGRARPGRDDALQRIVDRRRRVGRERRRGERRAGGVAADSVRRRTASSPPISRSRGTSPSAEAQDERVAGRHVDRDHRIVALGGQRDRLDGGRRRAENDRSRVLGDRVPRGDEAPQRVGPRAAVLGHDALGGAERGDRAAAGGQLAERRGRRARGRRAARAPTGSPARAIATASKRASSSATGSSARVMPATASGPGMTKTWSASSRSSCACHRPSAMYQRRTSPSSTGTNGTGLPARSQTSRKNWASAGCRSVVAADG